MMKLLSSFVSMPLGISILQKILYMHLCHHVVDYIGGLPLPLKVLGSCPYKKHIHEWKSELDKLKQFPNKEVQNVLKTIYFLILHFSIKGITKILSERY